MSQTASELFLEEAEVKWSRATPKSLRDTCQSPVSEHMAAHGKKILS